VVGDELHETDTRLRTDGAGDDEQIGVDLLEDTGLRNC
jgi:hypothetical protein